MYRKGEPKPDSGEIELGKRECKVNTRFSYSTFTVRNIQCDDLEIEFSLCNKIITTTAAPVSETLNATKDFEQFCFQTLSDFQSMLNDTTTTDVVIKVTLGEEKTFNCQKFILTGQMLFLIAIS